MNKKGFTVVELIVSFSLTIIITIFLVQIVTALNNLYQNSGVKTEILTKQALISSQINNKFNKKRISSLTSCGNYCLKFNYSDNTNDVFKIDYSNNTLQFGNFNTDLPQNSYFKDVRVDIIYAAAVQNDANDAILNIVIPIHNDEINEVFKINIAYQYNTDISNIEYVDFAGNGKYIVLTGDTEQTFNTQTAYVEQGYTVYDNDGNIIEGNVVVDNPLETVPYKAGNYKIKYSLVDSKNNIISQTTRSITVTPSTYNITNLITNGSFEDDFNGWASVIKGTTSAAEVSNEYKITGENSLKIVLDTNENAYILVDSSNTFSTPSNHKFYILSYAYIPTLTNGENGYFVFGEFWNASGSGWVLNGFPSIKQPVTKWSRYSRITTNASEYDASRLRFGPYFWNITSEASVVGYIDDILIVDLTATFGAGNEPTQEWCDENINWFDGTIKINY